MNVPQQAVHLHPPTRAGARRLRRKITLPVIVPSMAELADMRRGEKISLTLAGQAIDSSPSHLSRCERGERRLGLGKMLMLQSILLNYRKPTAPARPAPTQITVTVVEKSLPELMARAITGGSGPVPRATPEQLQQLATSINQRRIR